MGYVGKRRRRNPALEGRRRERTFDFLDRKHVRKHETRVYWPHHFGVLRGRWFK